MQSETYKLAAVPMEHHMPGWEIFHPNGTLFQVWGPGGERARVGWTAAWSDPVTDGGDYAVGPTMIQAMGNCFDTYGSAEVVREVKEAFKTAQAASH